MSSDKPPLRLIGPVNHAADERISRAVDAYCHRPPRWIAAVGQVMQSPHLPNLGRVLKAYLQFRAVGPDSSLTEADYHRLIRLVFQFLVTRELAFDIERPDAEFVCRVIKYLDQNQLIWSVDDVLKTMPWARPDYDDWVKAWQYGLDHWTSHDHFTGQDIATCTSLGIIVWLAKRSFWRRRRVDAYSVTSDRPN